jgi:DNA primase
MTINELKEYIYNEQKIEYVLEQIGCHNIHYNSQKEYWSAAHPDGDNPQGVNIRNNEYLNYRSFSRAIDYEDNKDLISLVESTNKLSFIEAIKYLHKILDLPFEFKKKESNSKKKIDHLNIFKRQLRSNRRAVNVDDIHILDDKLLDDFVPMLHIDWYREGIMPWTREKFKLAYSYKHKRVVIPMRFWLTGELLGFNQRTTVENYEEFGIKKYFITPTYPKALNLYGLYENYDSIQKAGYVVIAESEKSVLKRDSLGDGTVVALSGKSISDEQVRILMGLNVEIVIGLDKDVDVSEVRHMCEKFKNARKVSYIHDFMGILGDKDAPMDASNKDYQFLFESRIVYDRSEQRKYQESLRGK